MVATARGPNARNPDWESLQYTPVASAVIRLKKR